MRINAEDYLHKIDLYFKDKEPKDTYMIYVLVFASIFGFSYLLFWDSSLADFKTTRKHVVKLDKQIKKDEMFLRANPPAKIKQLHKEIDKINKQIIVQKDNNAYIKTKIETISSLIYDERAWGDYLDSIATNAQRYHVQILELTNQFSATNSNFGHLLDITVKSTANFKNTLNFINSLEQSELVVDLHDFNISATDRLLSDLNISVWGIRY
jgi:septal ring factor EnvC (AmiA/AmiB activator)